MKISSPQIPNFVELRRPAVPDTVCDLCERGADVPAMWLPDDGLAAWARELFIEGSNQGALLPFWNEDYAHLKLARIGFLWTNVECGEGGGKVRAGQAEIPKPRTGNAWAKSRVTFQMAQWFGVVPDFVITLCGPLVNALSDMAFCALVEHELKHCGQARDEMGEPKYTEDGEPKWCIEPHTVEEHSSVTARYGAWDDSLKELVASLDRNHELVALFDEWGNWKGGKR